MYRLKLGGISSVANYISTHEQTIKSKSAIFSSFNEIIALKGSISSSFFFKNQFTD